MQKQQCCVSRCPCSSNNEFVIGFPFPEDSETKNKWIQNIPEIIDISKTSIICMRHFSSHFLDKDGKKILLKNGAVPTIFSKYIDETKEGATFELDVANKPPICCLCLMNVHKTNSIDVSNDIFTVISTHFSFATPNENDKYSKIICNQCWQITETFHNFYQKIKTVYDRLIKTELVSVESITKDEENQNELSVTNNDKISIFVETLPSTQNTRKKEQERNTKKRKKKPKKRSSSNRDDAELLKYFDMKCDKCIDNNGQSLQFNSTDENRTHFKTIHKLMYRCNGICKQCKVQKTSASKMREHIRWHDKPFEFQCKICFKYAANQYNLRQHELCHAVNVVDDDAAVVDGNVLEVTGTVTVKRFQCDICEKRFTTKAAIYGHMQLKHTERKYKNVKKNEHVTAACDICGKKFYSKSTLNTHIKQVHEKLFKVMCDICGKGLYHDASLKMHKLIKHTPGNPLKVQCKICGSWHTNKMNLQSHTRLVHLEGMLPCPFCGKEIKSKTNLRYHIKLMHENNKRFKCPDCGEAYQKKYQLIEHISAKHTGEKLFQCEYCGDSFSRSWKRNDHIRKIHTDEWQRKKDMLTATREIISNKNELLPTHAKSKS